MKHILLITLMLGVVLPLKAVKIETGKNVTIDKPVYEDVYITGGEVTINAPVYGDLVIAGGTVIINDSVYNDILAAGGTITFNGYAGDDIRCAGGKLFIMKEVEGDVIVTGGNVMIGDEAVIGNLIAAGGEITLNGQVVGFIKTVAGKLSLYGNVMKDIDCRGGEILIDGIVRGKSVLAAGEKLTIGNTAVFYDDVRYWAPYQQINFNSSIKKGKAIYDPSLRPTNRQWYFLGFSSMLGVAWYLGTVFITILMIQYLFSRTMKKAGQTVFDKTVRSLGYGVLFWLAVPVAVVIACITVIGVPVGLLLLFSYIILALFAGTITSVVAANWLNNRSQSHWAYWRMVVVALGMFVIIKLLSLTPFLGLIVFALLVSIAFGSILQNINWRRNKKYPA